MENSRWKNAQVSAVDFAHETGRSFVSGITRDEQKAAGQFMTPPKIAKFMAERLVVSVDDPNVRILEPSAGSGILAATAVEALLAKSDRPSSIELLLYEQDSRLAALLEPLCGIISARCSAAGVRFSFDIRCEDFLLSELAVRGEPIAGLVTIANPPFFKINKTTDERAFRHAYAVHGQPNVYGLFMAATARLTPANGRWCFIAPRSWMNGQYFRSVRHTLLRHLTMDSLHAFDSRRESFEEDAVLQETVIAWATGRSLTEHGLDVLLTRSQGMSDLDDALVQSVPAGRIVSDNEHATLTLPSNRTSPLGEWSATLATYGLKVSTGPVVAFRNKDFIAAEKGRDTVPLLWLQHVAQQAVRWPIAKKREHVRATAANAWSLVPNVPMIVMRRFSPKEDERRITCAPYLGTLPGSVIGLENHLNYIHRPGGRMSVSEVRGLSALLASDVIDQHFREIAGSTQINAGELRSLPLPPLSIIEAIGARLGEFPTLAEVDAAVEAELGLTKQKRTAAA